MASADPGQVTGDPFSHSVQGQGFWGTSPSAGNSQRGSGMAELGAQQVEASCPVAVRELGGEGGEASERVRLLNAEGTTPNQQQAGSVTSGLGEDVPTGVPWIRRR